MTVQELLDLLEGVDPFTEVRIAYQPSYPMECSLGGVRLGSELPDSEREEAQSVLSAQPGEYTDEERAHARDIVSSEKTEVVYLLEGQHVGYASRDLWAL